MFNTFSIITCVLIENYFVALSLFLFHVVITASEEVIRYTFLNQNINSMNRNTLISFFNTLESGVMVISLLIIGFFSDMYSIGAAWVMMSLIALIISIPLFLYSNNLFKNKSATSSSINAKSKNV